MASPVDMVSAMGPFLGPASPVSGANGNDNAKLAQASQDLESLFIYHMLQQMRATVPESGLVSGGRAEKMYQQMLDSELAMSMAAQRGLGLARMMHENLSRAVEKSCGTVDAHPPDPLLTIKRVASDVPSGENEL